METSSSVRRAGFAVLAAGAAAVYAACGGGDDAPTPPDDGEPTVASVEVTPAQATLTVGQTRQFEAVARDAGGSAISGVDFAWSSDDEAVATVDGQGLATAQASGQTRIVAEADGVTGSADLSVTEPAAAASLEKVSGGGQNGITNQAYDQQLVVEARDEDGNPVEGVAIGWTVTSGAASLSSASTATGSDGRASVEVTAGETTGPITVEASAEEGDASAVSYDLDTTVALVVVGDNFFEDPSGRRNGSAAVTVSLGDTVLWDWRGDVDHTVTSETEPTDGESFDTDRRNSGTFRFAPGVEGTWEYFCEVHPGVMTGSTIDVTGG